MVHRDQLCNHPNMAQSVKEQANHFYNTHDWKKIIFSCLIFYVIYLIWANQLKLIKFKIGDSTFQGQALTAYSQEVIQINGTEIGDPCPMIPPNLSNFFFQTAVLISSGVVSLKTLIGFFLPYD